MASAALPIVSPVPEPFYPLLAVLLLTVGLVSTASFFIGQKGWDLHKVYYLARIFSTSLVYELSYEVTTTKFNRSLVREVTTGGVASFFLGFGTLFLLLWTGVYV